MALFTLLSAGVLAAQAPTTHPYRHPSAAEAQSVNCDSAAVDSIRRVFTTRMAAPDDRGAIGISNACELLAWFGTPDDVAVDMSHGEAQIVWHYSWFKGGVQLIAGPFKFRWVVVPPISLRPARH